MPQTGDRSGEHCADVSNKLRPREDDRFALCGVSREPIWCEASSVMVVIAACSVGDGFSKHTPTSSPLDVLSRHPNDDESVPTGGAVAKGHSAQLGDTKACARHSSEANSLG